MFRNLLKLFDKIFIYNRYVINNKAVIKALEAETKRRLGHYDEAMQLIDNAISDEKNNDMYYVTKSLILYDTKQYKSALEQINKALKINNKVERYKEIKKQIQQYIN